MGLNTCTIYYNNLFHIHALLSAIIVTAILTSILDLMFAICIYKNSHQFEDSSCPVIIMLYYIVSHIGMKLERAGMFPVLLQV